MDTRIANDPASANTKLSTSRCLKQPPILRLAIEVSAVKSSLMDAQNERPSANGMLFATKSHAICWGRPARGPEQPLGALAESAAACAARATFSP
jgi:hypothetical protein